MKDSGVITGAITIKLCGQVQVQAKAKQASAAMYGVIKVVQGYSGSTNDPMYPQQINAGSCMAPREKKISEAEESQESDAKLQGPSQMSRSSDAGHPGIRKDRQ